jgi:acyl-CoA dehydrogenase
MSTPGVSFDPIVDLAGEHHFNEVTFTDVFVPAHRILGTVGGAWRQVTEQLSFERGGPERFLSTYPLFALVLEHAGPRDRAAVGRLIARLATLRRLAWKVAASLDAGAAPIVDAATLKYLGNAFENDLVDFARETARSGAPALAAACGQALLASPGFTIRGGAADVLLSIIAKQETRP